MIENVYMSPDSVASFLGAIRYNRSALESVAEVTENYLLANGRTAPRLLDIGTGAGGFTVPLLEAFRRRGRVSATLDAFDVSPHMLAELRRALAAGNFGPETVSTSERDANNGLLGTYAEETYDVVIITFVLHYLKRWQDLLEEAALCLRPGGLLIQAEIVGDLRHLDQPPAPNSQGLVAAFWREYFSRRNEVSQWTTDLSVSNLAPALHHLSARGFGTLTQQTYTWRAAVTWRAVCDWVREGPVSSLGSGLTADQRRTLGSHMEKWLENEGTDPDNTATFRWGFRVTWMVKSAS